jgi:fucose 4-O-acetylase-like acetyltransferase
VLVSLGCGAIAGVTHTLSVDRVLSFLPFYVLGLTLRPEHIKALRQPRMRALGAAVLIAAWPLADRLRTANVHWIFWDRSYDALHVDTLHGIAYRGGLIVAAAATSLALIAVLPDRPSALSRWGRATLYGYLLHGFVVWGFKWTSLNEQVRSPLGYLLFVGACLVVSALLCSRAVQWLTKPVVEPSLGWLLKPTAERTPA